jgi:ACS family hexuronate transporter-like MFS transporter
MAGGQADVSGQSRGAWWAWWISVLLLLATMLNYMDRQALSVMSKRITGELQITNEQYGDLEFGFGVAFAAGSLVFGAIADRWSVRWLYPGVLLAWSAMGVLTAWCSSFESLLLCRMLLGFFESGHWPCALRTTKTIQTGSQRLMGNSILQSGGALGAIVTPLLVLAMVGRSEVYGAWRFPFQVIGSLGVVWAVIWLCSVRREDLPSASVAGPGSEELGGHWLQECLSSRKFWALVPVVMVLNITWQLIRAWLPKFLQEGRGATESAALYFNSLYFVAADVGCLAAGAGALYLSGRGLSTHRARLCVFGVCAILTALAVVAAVLPLGWGLYAVLLLVAAGSLGLFPCYYSMSQDLSSRNMGKAAGVLSAVGWLTASPLQKLFGLVVDRTGRFDEGLALVGLAPLVGFVCLLVIWREPEPWVGRGSGK